MNHLYRNNHDGTFTDVAAQLGIADVNRPGTGVSMGAVWGDYDNDGYEDLFLIKWGKPELFHNDGGKGFTRVTETAGLPPWINANTAVWLDYDNDGKLDLFVGGYYPESVNLWQLANTRMMPESFEYAKNGGANISFTIWATAGSKRSAPRRGSTAAGGRWPAPQPICRGQGYPDLFVANDYGVSELYLNDHGHFHEAGAETGMSDSRPRAE
jgi:hypothetical protein